jgi:hypothetical protein
METVKFLTLPLVFAFLFTTGIIQSLVPIYITALLALVSLLGLWRFYVRRSLRFD